MKLSPRQIVLSSVDGVDRFGHGGEEACDVAVLGGGELHRGGVHAQVHAVQRVADFGVRGVGGADGCAAVDREPDDAFDAAVLFELVDKGRSSLLPGFRGSG